MDIYNQMENMKSERKLKSLLIKDHDEKNSKYTIEINSIINENTKIKIYMEKMMDILNVESIDEIIEIFNKKKYYEESLYMQFQNLNKELNFLNIKLTEYQKEINDIENYINEKQANTETSEIDNDIKSSQFDSELEKIKKSNFQIIEKIRITEDLINRICRNIAYNEERLNGVIQLIHKVFIKKFNLKKKSQKNLFNLHLSELPFSLINIKERFNLNNGYDSNRDNLKSNSNRNLIDINIVEKPLPKFFEYSKDVKENKKSGKIIL